MNNVHYNFMYPLRQTLHCIFLFGVIPIIFKAIQNHYGEPCTSEVGQLKEIIHYISVKFSYPADSENIENKPIRWAIYCASLMIIIMLLASCTT